MQLHFLCTSPPWQDSNSRVLCDAVFMKHIETIEALIQTLVKSETFHALVVHSIPGWGKSTAIDKSLGKLGIQAVSIGSYATPLHIYNTFCTYPERMIVLDDSALLFSDPKIMAILKAATWQSSGNNPASNGNLRRISWGSTSDKVEQPFVDFTGKVILLTNVLPTGKETEAFLSRCLSYRIPIEKENIRDMLISAAQSPENYLNVTLAQEVASFLIAEPSLIDLMRVNLRTLKLGYDLAQTHPTGWRDLLFQLLPKVSGASGTLVKTKDAEALVAEMLSTGLSVKAQEQKYVNETGKSRRSFYLHRKKLGLSRAYRAKVE